MWQLKIYTFIMRCLILLFVAFHSFSMFTIFLNAIANLCMILFYLRQLLSMTQYILNYSHFLFLHKFNLRWLRNSFLWHAVADICWLACGSKMLFSIIFTTSPLAKSWIRAWHLYLGVKLDRTLTYREHMIALRCKVITRIALIRRLGGTSWGAS